MIQIDVRLQGISFAESHHRIIELHWNKSSETLSSPPIQSSVITEWAAYGLACVLIPFYTGLAISQVTQVGERVDFWIQRANARYGLEVSGTIDGNLVQRHRIKQRQLLQNQNQPGGYVSVTSFGELRSILSYHRISDRYL